MLCTVCKNFFRDVYGPQAYGKEADRPDVVPHQPSYTSLKQSYQQGCYVCYRLLNRLHLFWPSIVQIETGFCSPFTVAMCQYEDATWSNDSRLDLLFILSAEVQTTPQFESSTKGIECLSIFELWPKDGLSSWKQDGVVSQTTDITSCGPLVQSWLKECCASHQHCTLVNLKGQRWYPTRLLDLTNAEDGYVRLLESKSHVLEKPYATLSHCWGGTSFIRLTHGTYKSFLGSISLADMPNTFKNAIKVARYLQTDLLWIDSLTIIQDSEDDWIREAALMGDVYRNSHYNIGATGARNSLGGLFRSRKPQLLNPYPVMVNRTEHLLVWQSVWASGIDHSPLLQRGWVVQEHFLNPRMVHFADEQIFWECNDGVASEIHPERSFHEHPDDGISYESFKGANIALGQATQGADGDDAAENGYKTRAIDLWAKLIRRYSATVLSFETDKFVAISGLAKQMQGALQDEYIAGLWKRCLIFQLAWEVNRSYTARTIRSERYSRRPTLYTAPSWSWASIDGEVIIQRCYEAREEELSTVIGYDVELATADTTGKVRNGRICIQGPVTKLSISMIKTRGSGLVKGYEVTFEDAHVASKDSIVSMDLDTGEQTWQRSYYFLALLFSRHFPKIETGSNLLGILLEPKIGSDVDFCRAGFVRARRGSSFAKTCQKIRPIPSLSGLAFDDKYGHTIHIV